MRGLILLTIILLIGCDRAESAESKPRPWATDPVWQDGLVEKAVYTASRVVYGKPRPYEAIAFTNQEAHDVRTLTKAQSSGHTMSVWKHNWVEVIPTPNYDYKYLTTAHLLVDSTQLTRLDCSSQEFCGTSFKQYQQRWPSAAWDYFAFSYMPEAGRKVEMIKQTDRPIVAQDSLPLYLRNFDFAGKAEEKIALLPEQRSNKHSPHEPINSLVRHAGEEGGLHKLEVVATDKNTLVGTYWMASDRLHIMVRYASGNGEQTYELKDLSRVNYWTITE